jgi:ribosome-associated protein
MRNAIILGEHMAKKTKTDTNAPEEEIIFVSRTELKRDAKELHQLGVDIASLSKKQRETIPMDDELFEAMELADRLKTKTEAFRRHLNYLSKLLRLATNIDDIINAYNIIQNKHAKGNVLFHKIEHLRDEIIENGDSKINELVEQHPELDRQRLRQLARQAKKEKAANKPAKAYREIFQCLKQFITH